MVVTDLLQDRLPNDDDRRTCVCVYECGCQQIIKLNMQSPHNINLRSHHSLKSSSLQESHPSQHMNPLSSRPSLTKKLSLNSKPDTPTYSQPTKQPPIYATSIPISKGYYPYEYSSETRNGYASNVGNIKNQLFITLGSRAKEQPGHSGGYATGGPDLHAQIQYILGELDKCTRRLGALEHKATQNCIFKQEITSKLGLHPHNPQMDPHNLKNQIQTLKSQLNKVTDRKELEHRIFQQCQIITKQSIAGIRSMMSQQIGGLDTKMEKILRKQMERIREEFQSKFQMYENTICQYFQNIKDRSSREGGLLDKITPLLSNPNLRLKFLSKLSLIEPSTPKNPQQPQQCQIQSYSHIYMVDKDGYLLDQAQRYIVDRKGQCIRLDEWQIKALVGLASGTANRAYY